jgi:hypothetical protein
VEKKTLLTAALISALLFSAVAATHLVGVVRSDEYSSEQSEQTVIIKADGSVDPASAPILRNGDIYTLLSDIDCDVVLERNNTVFDGAEHAVGGISGPLPVQIDYQWQADGMTNVTVIDTVVHGGGIIFYWLPSSNLTIANNTLNNGTGLQLYCSGSIITNNTLNGGKGIGFAGSGNIIFGNHMTNCNYTNNLNNPKPFGIVVSGSHNTIVGNIIAGTTGNAIDFVRGSYYNIIAGNQITDNEFGIHTTYAFSQGGAENNIIYYNNFIDNIKNVDNEAVLTTTISVNSWDNGAFGNYWSDYTGTDANGDGIGDINYAVDSNNTDHYPLMAPVDISKITVDSLVHTPTSTPAATPTPSPTTTMPTSTPDHSPTSSPTPSLTSSPSPEETETPSESNPFPTVPVAAGITSAVVVCIGLLIYFQKRKH